MPNRLAYVVVHSIAAECHIAFDDQALLLEHSQQPLFGIVCLSSMSALTA